MRAEIEQHFGDCKFQHKCLCSIKSSFEFTEEKEFFIYDEKGTEQPVRIVSSNAPFHLTVTNPNSKLICLTKTDNCLLTDDTRKCDCILFDDSKLFFVEIKSFNKNGRRKNRKEAIEQLEISIKLFKELTDKGSLDIAAIICFNQTEPRIPIVSAATTRATFLASYKVRLEEGNVIEF